MKIAIATDGTNVAAHFGHCSSFTIVTVNDGQVVQKEVIANPGHRPGFLPGFLARLGICTIIAGGMGSSAIELFRGEGVQPITGVSSTVDAAIQDFLSGTLQDGAQPCRHEEGAEHHCR